MTANRVSGWRRLSAPSRVQGVDLARGLAVIGMLAAHLTDVGDFAWGDPETWGGIVHGRSSILFATLAGVSIGLMSGGRRPLEGRALSSARRRIAVRAAAIWTLGVLLIATGIPVYVILPAYAILFLLALPLLRLRARALFVSAGVVAIVGPVVFLLIDALPFWRTTAGWSVSSAIGWHYPFVVWVAFILVGMGMARVGLRSTAVLLRFAGTGILLAVVGYALPLLASGESAPLGSSLLEPAPLYSAVLSAEAHSSGIGETIGSGGFAIAVIALCVLLCRTPATWIVLPVRAVGSMPLTAYAGQILGWLIGALALGLAPDDLSGFRALEPLGAFVVTTLVFCTVWALTVGRGPLEWLLDRLARLAR